MSDPLFEHLAEVGGEISSGPGLLLGLDFDGTLAPIVPHPDDARVPADTLSILRRLALRPDITIAIVSGRALPDLASRVGVDVILAGNHGLEIGGRGLSFRHAQAESGRSAIHRICAEISRQSAGIAGALVEDKGLTASVHFRNAESTRRNELVSIVRGAAEAARDRIELREGKQVLEILPRTAWNKGTAVRWILEQLQGKTRKALSLCYLGDDATDENVFRAFDGITICVGEGNPTAARFTVRDTVEAAGFLRWLSSIPLSARCSRQAPDPSGAIQPSANR